MWSSGRNLLGIGLLLVLCSNSFAQEPVLDELLLNLTQTSGEILYALEKNLVRLSAAHFIASTRQVALVVQDGYCIIAFVDPYETSRPAEFFAGYKDVCNNNGAACCSVRASYVNAFMDASWKSPLEAAIQNYDCSNSVVTGYDHGAGLAAVAAIHWGGDLLPSNLIYIAFRQPELMKLDDECLNSAIDTSRWYRYLNTRVDLRLHIYTLVYDFSYKDWHTSLSSWLWTWLVPPAQYAGHLLVLATNLFGNQTRVAWLGENSQQAFRPVDWTPASRPLVWVGGLIDNTPGFDPPMYGGYLDRIAMLRDEYQASANNLSYPVQLRFSEYSLCTLTDECVEGTSCFRTVKPPPHWISPARCRRFVDEE